MRERGKLDCFEIFLHKIVIFINKFITDPMIEEFAHMPRNEKHNQLEYTLQNNHHPKVIIINEKSCLIFLLFDLIRCTT